MSQGHFLGGVGRVERIRAGKVDDVEQPALDVDKAVGMLDRRSRKVRGLGLMSGDGIEKSALAAIGLPDENGDRRAR